MREGAGWREGGERWGGETYELRKVRKALAFTPFSHHSRFLGHSNELECIPSAIDISGER